jgi:hypothetical protein
MMNENKYTRMDIARKSPCQTYNNAARHGTLPDGIVCTTAKKRRRRRSTKQIDLHSAGAHNRIENPKRYKILRKQKMKTSELKNKVETPVQHFNRICGGRVGRAKYAIELIGNCVGSGYEHTDGQVDKIESVLLDELQKTLDKLRSPVSNSVKNKPKHFVKL